MHHIINTDIKIAEKGKPQFVIANFKAIAGSSDESDIIGRMYGIVTTGQ